MVTWNIVASEIRMPTGHVDQSSHSTFFGLLAVQIYPESQCLVYIGC